jgi:hypothetical protein
LFRAVSSFFSQASLFCYPLRLGLSFDAGLFLVFSSSLFFTQSSLSLRPPPRFGFNALTLFLLGFAERFDLGANSLFLLSTLSRFFLNLLSCSFQLCETTTVLFGLTASKFFELPLLFSYLPLDLFEPATLFLSSAMRFRFDPLAFLFETVTLLFLLTNAFFHRS